MKTLLTGAVVVTCDSAWHVYAPGDVVIEGDRIQYVGERYAGEYDERIPATGRLLLPGLINAHTHAPMSIFRSLADDVDLMVFLEQRVWPREVRLRPDDVYAGTVLSAIEMLKSGVTCYADMYFFEDDLLRAAVDTGIRALVTPGIIQSPAWEPILGTWEQRTARVIEFCRKWQGHEGRIHTGVGPHAPYTLPFPALGEIAAEARKNNLPVHIHLLETQHERDAFNREHKRGTVAALEQIGFFDGPVLAAHSVWLEDDDVDIYRHHGTGIANCPQSNCKLGSGVAPVADLLARGVAVGLGTDGAATNNNLDVWEEMRLAPLLAKVSALDPKPIPARQALDMATSMGARATFLPELGALAEGCKADIVMVNVEDTTAVPIFGPDTWTAHLVYSMDRRLVDSVWVNGKRVVKGGEVLSFDEADARRRAQAAAIAVSQRVQGG